MLQHSAPNAPEEPIPVEPTVLGSRKHYYSVVLSTFDSRSQVSPHLLVSIERGAQPSRLSQSALVAVRVRTRPGRTRLEC